MQINLYHWPATRGLAAAVLTVSAVLAYDLATGDADGGFMAGYLAAMVITAVEYGRTRRSFAWTRLSFLATAGLQVLLALAATGAFRFVHTVFG